MFTMPAAPKSIGGVLDDAFQLYRQCFRAVWPLAALGFVLSMLVLVLVGWRFFAAVAAGEDPEAMLGAVYSPGLWGAGLLSMIITAWFYAAQLLSAHGVAQGEWVSFTQALQRGLSMTPAILIGGIVYVFVIGLAFGLLVPASVLIPSAWLRLVVVLLFLLAPLFFSVSLYFFHTAIVVDATGPFAGLGQSYRLVRGNWWRTTALLSVGFILLLIVYVAVGLVSDLLAMPITDVAFNVLVSSILDGLLASAVAPFLAALSLVVYYDLKLRKFGGDLEARVGALAG
jgi:hypothetical protein